MIDEFVEPGDRAVSLWTYHCTIPSDYIGEWESLSQEAKNEFETRGPVPCDGGFSTGSWCNRCRFGKERFVDEETFD